MKVKAAVLRGMRAPPPYSHSRPLSIEEVELNSPGPVEVLVRIAAAGLCHSDLSVINGDRPRPMPMVLGHEAAGIVVELGAQVEDLAIGDHVVMVFMPSCGHCLRCAEGRPALCEPGAAANAKGELLDGGTRIRSEREPLHHHLGCSAFAEHAVVSRHSLVKIGKELPLTHAALFGCAVLTGVGAVVNTARVQAGQTVAVVGLGGVGLSSLLGAITAGAARVIGVDLSANKLDLARELGATDVLDGGDPDVADQVRKLTSGGADFVFEMSGSIKALENAVRMTRRGGTTVTAGLPPADAALSVNIVSLVSEERTLRGSYIGTCVPARDVPRYIALYQHGRLPVDRLMSDFLRLEEINHAFDRLREGAAVRQIIQF